MKIGIIGAGFTGLSAAYYLQKKGHDVSVFEIDSRPGGLALGYKENNWKWTLEQHYHHWFTNDKSVLNLAKDIHHPVIIKRPKTSSFVENDIYQLDSPFSLLKFPKLSLINRFRMGIVLFLLRYNPLWKPLEKLKAEPVLLKMMGKIGYKKIWEPLMVNKLGKYAKTVSLAWFWARIYKRTSNLAYPKGGFLRFALHLEKEVKNLGGKFYYNTNVIQIASEKKPEIKFKPSSKNTYQKSYYDIVIVTLPTPIFIKIAKNLPQSYINKLKKLKGIGAINLILRLSKPFFNDGTYWLNMCDLKSPILAIVEHTNFMDKKNYNGEHLLYIGNYMETTDKRFTLTKEELLKLYDPWLKKINPNYQSQMIKSPGKDGLSSAYKLFRAPFAQPIIFKNYSKYIPQFSTPLKNVYLTNINQVYPWDRGTNYAVELGKKIASYINDHH